jgi:hypothetical protein
VLCCPLRFLYKNSLPYVFTSSCLYEGSCLIYVICVCLCTVVSNTYVYPMLPVFLDCPFLVAPSVFNVSVFCVVFFALFSFVLCLVSPMFPVSLDCSFLIAPSVFSNVYLFCWSSSCVLCTQCYQFLWNVFVLKNEQSRETGNIGDTRHRTKENKTNKH